MSFFQNPFTADFEGNWVLADRHHIPKFVLKRNTGRGDEFVQAWTKGPYNMSGNDTAGNSRNTLVINYSLNDSRNWAALSINVATGAASSSAVTAYEIVTRLNADTTFASLFVASIEQFEDKSPRVSIRQRKPFVQFKFYISNGRAEEAMTFNARAGVGELPSYFARHTIANRFTYTDSAAMLIALNTANAVDQAVITNAVDNRGTNLGLVYSDPQLDYELLKGRSGLFQFTKGPSANAVSTTTTVITYPAGAVIGDLAKKTVTQYDASTVIVAQYEIPYTLTNSDLVTPP